MSCILRYTKVKTRSSSVCFGCGRKFEPPTKMIAAAHADGGTVSSYYLCETCDTITSNMRYDEFGFSDLRDEALAMEEQAQ